MRRYGARLLTIAAVAVAALSSAACGVSSNAASKPTFGQEEPTTTEAMTDMEGTPTTSPPSITPAQIGAALQQAGVPVCNNDAAEGTSGDVEGSVASHHWRFGTTDPSTCDSQGTGELRFRVFSDTASVNEALSADQKAGLAAAAYACGLTEVVVSNDTPPAMASQAQAVISQIPGCTPRQVTDVAG